MIDRSLRIAFGISLGIHIFAMSAVMIVIPEKAGRKRSLTRVDFLGPILEKTAFDIMLESASPAVETTYSLGDAPFGYRDLQVSPPGRMSLKLEFPQHLENRMDSIILSTLTGYKIVPDFYLDVEEGIPGGRKVIYTPDQPFVMKSLYGGKNFINVKVRALVDSSGTVRKTESVTTTGYPQLDILAAKYVRSWTFEARETGEDEWIVLDVTLNTGD